MFAREVAHFSESIRIVGAANRQGKQGDVGRGRKGAAAQAAPVEEEKEVNEVSSSLEGGSFFGLESVKRNKRKREEDDEAPEAEVRVKTDRGWIAKGKAKKQFL